MDFKITYHKGSSIQTWVTYNIQNGIWSS